MSYALPRSPFLYLYLEGVAMRRRTGRSISIVVLSVLLVAPGYCGTGMDSVVPKDCVMFLRLRSPEAFGAHLRKTALGRAVTATELADAGLGLASNGARFFSALAMGVPMTALREHFLNDLGFAVFDIGADPQRVPPMALLLDVSRDPAQAKSLVEDTILPRLQGLAGGAVASKERYQSVMIQKLQAPQKPPLYWTFLGSICVVGNEEGVKKIIDGSKSPPETLAASQAYLAGKGQPGVGAGARCYINTGLLVDKVRPLLPTRKKQREGLTMTGVLSAKALSVSTSVEGEGMRDRFHVFTGDTTMGLFRLAGHEPAANYAATGLVPEGQHLCVAAKLSSGAALIEAFKGILVDVNGEAQMAQLSQLAQGLEQQAAIRWTPEFINALGGELFFSLRLPNFAELAWQRRGPSPEDFNILIGLALKEASGLFGGVCRPVVPDNVDLADVLRGLLNEPLEERDHVVTVPAVGRLVVCQFAGAYVQSCNQSDRPMSLVLEFNQRIPSWGSPPAWVEPFQSLNTWLLIDAVYDLVIVQFACVQVANGVPPGFILRVVLRGEQEVLVQVRLDEAIGQNALGTRTADVDALLPGEFRYQSLGEPSLKAAFNLLNQLARKRDNDSCLFHSNTRGAPCAVQIRQGYQLRFRQVSPRPQSHRIAGCAQSTGNSRNGLLIEYHRQYHLCPPDKPMLLSLALAQRDKPVRRVFHLAVDSADNRYPAPRLRLA